MDLDQPSLEASLEDGELDDSDTEYTPLERPQNYGTTSTRFPVTNKSESEEEPLRSSSDSDSDSQILRAKRSKIVLKRPRSGGSGRKTNNVWSTRAQEDSLLETMVGCDVTTKDRSRDVESYDYTLSENYKVNQKLIERTSLKNKKRTNNKRNRDDMKNNDLRLTKLAGKKVEEATKGNSRCLLDLTSNPESTNEEFGMEIANKLCEEKEDLIVKIVDVLGKDKARDFYEHVQRIEADGGMLLLNQSRRRTPGGVFLFLVKHDDDITKVQRDIIFEDDVKNYKEYMKNKKKERAKQMREKIRGVNNPHVPPLLSKADLVAKLSKEKSSPKGSDQEDVVNPPPTPESGDCMDASEPQMRAMTSYESDVLDLNAADDMDLF